MTWPVPVVRRGRLVLAAREILKAQAGILDTDPPELAVEKVRKVGGQLITRDVSADPARANAALAYTIGLEDPDVSIATSDPREVRDDLHAAWRSFFSALAGAGLVIVLVEDIHWADPALLDLLEDAADRSEGPLLFLCPARPELTARRPEWGGGRWNHSSLLLEPLSTDESAQLLELLVESGALSSDLRALILERAGGNPFFLEEIVQRLLEEPAGVEDLEIPDTVQGVLAARIDLLMPLEKRVVQSAAVVGRTFWIGPFGRCSSRIRARSSWTRSCGGSRTEAWSTREPAPRSWASASSPSATS